MKRYMIYQLLEFAVQNRDAVLSVGGYDDHCPTMIKEMVPLKLEEGEVIISIPELIPRIDDVEFDAEWCGRLSGKQVQLHGAHYGEHCNYLSVTEKETGTRIKLYVSKPTFLDEHGNKLTPDSFRESR